jgi:hypothetical protein
MTLASDHIPTSLLDKGIRCDDFLVSLVTSRVLSQQINTLMAGQDAMYDDPGSLVVYDLCCGRVRHTVMMLVDA